MIDDDFEKTRATILSFLADRAIYATICLSEVARAIAGEGKSDE